MTLTTITSRALSRNTSSAKRASRDGPVVITERGRPAYVLMTYADYERLTLPNKSLAEVFAMPGGADADIDLDVPRVVDPPRDIDLS